MNSLVTIIHPRGDGFLVPRMPGVRTPARFCEVPTPWVEGLRTLGYLVEVHKEPYCKIEEHNERVEADRAARRLASATPEAKENILSLDGMTDEEISALTGQPADPEPEVEPQGEEKEEMADQALVAGEDQPVEGATLSPEELASLKAKIEALKTLQAAKALAAEYAIEFKTVPKNFTEYKAALLAEVAAAEELLSDSP